MSSSGANARNEFALGEAASRVVAKRPCQGLDIGLCPALRAGPRGGERERLDTDGTRVGRVCGGKDGDGGTDEGSCAPGSASLDTFDLTLIAPRFVLTTDEEPEWFSSFEEFSASLGGE